MGRTSGIQWTDGTWNVVRGCEPISPGCAHCYAPRDGARAAGPGGAYEGLIKLAPKGAKGHHPPKWTGEVRFIEELLDAPIRWTKPQRIFVNSMSDLFHHAVTDLQIAAIVGVMALAGHHTFQVLTKRTERMRNFFQRVTLDDCISATLELGVSCSSAQSRRIARALRPGSPFAAESEAPLWPLPNVWIGTSIEDQRTADLRLPLLTQTPAAVRFLSAEPLLGQIDLVRAMPRWAYMIDLVIVGGESGPNARPCSTMWFDDIIRQCDTGEPRRPKAFVKQLGRHAWDGLGELHLHDKKGGDPDEWPVRLRRRELPGSDPRVCAEVA